MSELGNDGRIVNKLPPQTNVINELGKAGKIVIWLK